MPPSFALFSMLVLLLFTANSIIKTALHICPENNRRENFVKISHVVDSFLGTTLIFLAVSMLILMVLSPIIGF